MCESNGCENEATDRVFWPGKEPLAMCNVCKDRALLIADALGMHLHTEAIVRDAVRTLGSGSDTATS